MEIIKQGKIRHRFFRGTCSNCDCEVECNKEEINVFNDRNELVYSVECPTPQCGQTILLEVIEY